MAGKKESISKLHNSKNIIRPNGAILWNASKVNLRWIKNVQETATKWILGTKCLGSKND